MRARTATCPLFLAERKDERYDPNGGSRQDAAFSNYIADYRDFKAYAAPKDPSVGNEFYDLVSYNGWLRAILSDSAGFAVYKGRPAVTGGSPFPDGKSGSYRDDATAWAAANGIVTGYEGGEFRPGQTITRQEMAAILYRFRGYQK